jgi:phosphate acetyltransferase
LAKRLTGSRLNGGVADEHRTSHPRLFALMERAQSLPAVTTAVVFPHDLASLHAAIDATEAGFINPVFYGSASRMQNLAEQANLSIPGVMNDTGDSSMAAARAAVADAGCGRVQALMKGSLHTDELLSPVVARDSPIRGAGRMTHSFIFDLPRYHKLLAVTDAVINIAPDVRTKADAITNALQLLKALGVTAAKVAIVAAVETVNANIPATMDAVALVALAREGRFGLAIIEGPFGFDNAISSAAAQAKGIVSIVAGDPDLLVVPDLNSGNILYKSFVYMGGGECAGIVQGARIPIILTSRADSHFSRIASCALACTASAAA